MRTTFVLALICCLVAQAALAGSPYRRRAGFRTAIHDAPATRTPPPAPPPGTYELVHYAAPLGQNAAYVTPVRRDGVRRPAILWLQGGFDWSIDDSAWKPAAASNDQSARAFREAGMVEMLPSLRGCNGNPGQREYFLGEVDDVLAALEFLRKRPDVDPERVYLGGHSTGATLALLAAADRPPVRAVFAFGPIAFVGMYGRTGTGLDRATAQELVIRSPAASIAEIEAPTFVIEGDRGGNTASFAPLLNAAKDAPVHFLVARGATHFSTLAPITRLLAERLVREPRSAPPLALTEGDLAAALKRK